ncbi:glycine cleavage system aminomethyltransferase GcvT [Planctomicrobium sp. SH664]|uniref:glycine cleavage system aminomethyltransferase GcvT n=1 Tax=Planctomicrobium sp. SH664 TaxID=3448125 RepID=UPI003F5BAC00
MFQTALHDWHTRNGARMVEFAGWHMPIQFTTIVDEHHAIRRRVGLFDISHMGRLWFSGQDHIRFLDRILTNHVAKMSPGMVRYSLVCKCDGGILDDVLIYRFENECLLVVNGANREKIVHWIEQNRNGDSLNFEDRTLDTCMIAIQGPKSQELLQPLTDCDLASIKYYRAAQGTVMGFPAVISRTGYTGEDGFEITVDNAQGEQVWAKLMEAGEPDGIAACGLGCRDTLRLEAAMPLYGHEMDESVDPFTAALGFGVKLNKGDFIGREALDKISQQEDLPQRVGLKLDGKRIARQGAELIVNDRSVGYVTSGTFSPTLEVSLAMGFLPAEYAAPGTRVEVDIRGKREPATVVALPFYRR